MSEVSSNVRTDRQTGGKDCDGLLKLMRRFNIPITRENYLDLAYRGEVPAELSADEEANLPPMLR